MPFDIYAACPSWPPLELLDEDGVQIKTGPFALKEKQLAGWAQLRQMAKGYAVKDKYKLTDEDILLRYYVARNFDAEKAFESVKATEAWRREQDMDNVQQWAVNKMPPDVYMQSHSGMHGFFGFDNEGYPIMWERPHQKGLGEFVKLYGSEVCLKYHHACMERVRELPKLLGVDRVTWVIDMRDCGVTAMTGLTGAQLKLQSKVDQEFYPECMRKMFIINAPFGFSGSFSVIKHFLDARVQQKICIDGKRHANDSLSKWVSDDNIPVEFGGSAVVDWDKCRMRPTTDLLAFQDERYLKRIYELNPELRPPAPEAKSVTPTPESESTGRPIAGDDGPAGPLPMPRRTSNHSHVDPDGIAFDLMTCMSFADVSDTEPDAPASTSVKELSSAQNSPTPLRPCAENVPPLTAQAQDGPAPCGCCIVS